MKSIVWTAGLMPRNGKNSNSPAGLTRRYHSMPSERIAHVAEDLFLLFARVIGSALLISGVTQKIHDQGYQCIAVEFHGSGSGTFHPRI